MNAFGISSVDERAEDIDNKMMNKHKSTGLIDLIKMSSSSPPKREEVKLPLLNNNLSHRKSNMTKSHTPNKFDYEKFTSKFEKLGKDIMNIELKTKN